MRARHQLSPHPLIHVNSSLRDLQPHETLASVRTGAHNQDQASGDSSLETKPITFPCQ